MKPCSVESRCHGKLYVAFQGFIGRCRPYPVRIESLVEDEAEIHRLIVEIEPVADNLYLPHPGIRLDVVDDLSFRGEHIVFDVVEERVFRRPCLHFLHSEFCLALGRGRYGLLADCLSVVQDADAEFLPLLHCMVFRSEYKPALVQVRDYVDILQPVLVDCFHPDCLPDAGGTGVFASERCVSSALFPLCIFSRPFVILHTDYHVVGLSCTDQPGNVDGKGG